jgi:uncharacterized membrane protein YagU involved in acid resistance
MAHVTHIDHRYAHFSLNWEAAVGAAIIAGAVFVVLEMLMAPLFLGMSPWAPVRMIAAMTLGQEVLPASVTFNVGFLAAALIVHFALSIIYSIIFGLLLHRWMIASAAPASAPLVALSGLIFALGLYLINFYGFTAVFPWFADARNWVSVVVHLVYGLALAVSYRGIAGRSRVEARPPER